jgi:carbonic anhydrase
MKFITSMALATLATLSLVASEHTTAHQESIKKVEDKTTEHKTEHKAHWGYTGHTAPDSWGSLDPKFVMCKTGINQSPINITNKVSVDTDDLQKIYFHYETAAKNIVNNGHTIQVNMKDGSGIMVDGIEFHLIQFHFHTPSENEIEGRSFPLEAHFVHASDDGKLAVIAVLFEDGKENPVIKKIWDKMPTEAGKSAELILDAETIRRLLPAKKDFYRFNGSLTTPPCSEGVRWLVLKDYSSISTEQTKEFFKLFDHANNRPVQAIGARKVMK